MTYPSLQEWLQDVQVHTNNRRPLAASQDAEREGRLVYWKPVDPTGPIPHDVLYFNDKMLFYEAPRFIPRSFMIARVACKGGKSHSNPPLANTNFAKYVVDLDHLKDHRDPDTYEVVHKVPIIIIFIFLIEIKCSYNPMSFRRLFDGYTF